MANAGDFFRTSAGNAYLNLVAPSLPANLYAAAFTDSVTWQGAGTEVADPAANGINYARKVFPASAFTDNGNGVFSLTSVLDFNQAVGGGWSTIVSIAIVTVATGSIAGNVVAFDDVDVAKAILEYDTLRLGSGVDWVISVM